MGESLHLSIPEEEAAYLTLHFQASVERLHKGQSNPKKVIIICHMGIGMSQLLRTKIERKFPSVHVEASMAKAEVHDYLATHKVDLVISTVALSGLKIPHIHVSPCWRLETSESWNMKLNSLMSQTTDKNPFF